MKNILAIGLFTFFLFLLARFSNNSRDQEPVRPNIVLVMADDLGYSDIGCYGSEIATPNIDRLAFNGLRFRQFYNAARCCPSRASLLTGLYPHQTGMGRMVSSLTSDPKPGPYQGFLNNECVTIAEVLQTAGYRSYISGKWHVGERPEHWPRQRGFDRYFGLISGASSYFEIIGNQKRVRQMALDDERWEPPDKGFYMTDAITDYAIKFLLQHRAEDSEQPFFLYIAYTAPHWPLHALPEDIKKYEGKYSTGWNSLREERYRRMLASGIIENRYRLSARPPSIPGWAEAENKKDWERRMTVYAAMVDRMDQNIGRILETLEDIGVFENTLIVFLSDNGACAESVVDRGLHNPNVPIGDRGSYVAYQEPWANVSNTPLRRYKRWVHEGGVATPFIAHWPLGIKQPGRITDEVGHVIDIMPTCLDLAGVAYPDSFQGKPIIPLEGRSLIPVLQGKQWEGHDTIFWEHLDNRAVRQGKWKLVYASEVGKWELYNMKTDPSETENLINRFPEKERELEQRWQIWANKVGVVPPSSQ